LNSLLVAFDSLLVPSGKRRDHARPTAAERSHPIAQNMLGTLHNAGTAVPQDPQKAVEWDTKAAAQRLR